MGGAGKLTSILDRLKQILLRLLLTDQDGEGIACKRAITRLLANNGVDAYAFADAIGIGGYTEEQARRACELAREAGYRAAEEKFFGSADYFNIDGSVDWHRAACWAQRNQDDIRLNDWERGFTSSVAAWTYVAN